MPYVDIHNYMPYVEIYKYMFYVDIHKYMPYVDISKYMPLVYIHKYMYILTYTSTCLILTGYIEKELKKDELKIPDSDSNPKAPAPKEMVDLEVNS